ncbi:hypothetical protein Mp_6g12360 [Marchantia polymorpha subsp. ruderalis]|uniref:Glycoside hydrolase family 31 TIM barrel domain-containing protein n=2 Tax=Marchantia polymorpha TaxID=3197 RepID=A0AAF6BR76_MARPO|nr:hypothetical protein MARPO_0059s0108 [Marchantia polymorpha]BBN14510.1 hypothetical protein Mp_6g12360 [Marchantia polymorpha subsp. ruderalis]|eukprot:PTQ37208.1 hypothetical protein MARPO_0059s0108 [Marchantia polymorpha]
MLEAKDTLPHGPGLSGQPFSGPDIGGFGGNATPQMFARWMGIGAILPFARGHSEKGTVDHEPWEFGKESTLVLPASKNFIDEFRLVCLRVHPSFKVANYELALVKFTSISGEAREIVPKPGDIILTADDRPNGEWAFLDKENGVAIVNRFNPEQVFTCVIHWSAGICNLELWSEERPVSKETPFQICHEYETVSEQELLQSQT